MTNFSNKKSNYCLKILSNCESVKDMLEKNNFTQTNYKYHLQIYMVNKNEEFFKIKKLSDIKDYAIIDDDNGDRKVILNNNGIHNAKVHSVFLIHDILYNLGYYELFYINKDTYEYKYKDTSFKILNVKDEGCFLNLENVAKSKFKELVKLLEKCEIKFDMSNNKIDIIQLLLNKALPKK